MDDSPRIITQKWTNLSQTGQIIFMTVHFQPIKTSTFTSDRPISILMYSIYSLKNAKFLWVLILVSSTVPQNSFFFHENLYSLVSLVGSFWEMTIRQLVTNLALTK